MRTARNYIIQVQILVSPKIAHLWVCISARLCQVSLSYDSQLQGEGLEEYGHAVGQQDDNEQLVAIHGASLQVRCPAVIARASDNTHQPNQFNITHVTKTLAYATLSANMTCEWHGVRQASGSFTMQ